MKTETYLYHATLKRFYRPIKKQGLHAKKRKSFEGQTKDNLVYFAFDEDVAASYAECMDNVPDKWMEDEIIILSVKKKALNKKLLRPDPNMLYEPGEKSWTIAYEGTVPPENLYLLNTETKEFIPVHEIKRISKKYYY